MWSCLDYHEERRRNESNVEARVHAQGWAMLMSALTKGQFDAKLLLPYPEEITNQNRKISHDAANAFIRVMEKRILPPKIVATIRDIVRSDLDDLENP